MKRTALQRRYDKVMAPWKVDLALRRLRKLGFPGRHWPDLMQELAILILGFQYDPDRANGATEQTALYAVITKHLCYRMRGRYREMRGMERYLREMGVHDDGTTLEPDPFVEFLTPLQLDVRQQIARLPEFDRAVAEGLSQGMNKAELARDLNCDWHTIDAAARRIAERFQTRELDGWVIK